MKDIKLKLKLNKVYERQLLMRRKLWDMEETINAIEKLHKDNVELQKEQKLPMGRKKKQ